MHKADHIKDLSPQEWHKRFVAQETWTNNIRTHVYAKLTIPTKSKILEIGSGTGAVLSKTEVPGANVYGLDLKFSYLRYCQGEFSQFILTCGDGLQLPYCDDAFDIVYCHYLLLWVENPVQLVREMIRVGKTDGYMMIFAEPDYGGRVDHPVDLMPLGEAQTKALSQQGADPFIGRRLKEIAVNAGIHKYHSGILGNESDQSFSLPYWESEWRMIEHDLSHIVSADELEQYKYLDLQAQKTGVRTLFVPTFYLWAKISK